MVIYFNGYTKEYAEEIATILTDKKERTFKTYTALADYLGISKASVSLAVNRKRVAYTLAMAMMDKQWINSPPAKPKEIRHRRWMRTDNIRLALDTLLETYPEIVKLGEQNGYITITVRTI